MPAGKSWQGSGALLPTVLFCCFAVTGPFIPGFQSLWQAGACLFSHQGPWGWAGRFPPAFLRTEPWPGSQEACVTWAATCSPRVSVSLAEN